MAYLLLEDGSSWEGESVGGTLPGFGEVVFNTGMTGYQESVTDPSYRGQILVFTAPMVGNYGVSDARYESSEIHVRGVVMREGTNDLTSSAAEQGWISWLQENSIPVLTGVDTRSLVQHIRDKGAMRGGIAHELSQETIQNQPLLEEQPLVNEVSTSSLSLIGEKSNRPKIALIDTGVKRSIINQLLQRGATIQRFPPDSSPETILKEQPDIIFLANGPGNPAALANVVSTIRALLGKAPVYGICMGHQLLAQAVGLSTYKLPYGHRGTNHPVKDVRTGKIYITSQNHGYAVMDPHHETALDTKEIRNWDSPWGTIEISHVSLYDHTIEGLWLPDLPARSVQYHPEAHPGPSDASPIFDDFFSSFLEREN